LAYDMILPFDENIINCKVDKTSSLPTIGLRKVVEVLNSNT
jgi:hypothetical protein